MKEQKEKDLKVSVKGNIRDLLAFKNLTSQRKKNIEKASDEFHLSHVDPFAILLYFALPTGCLPINHG